MRDRRATPPRATRCARASRLSSPTVACSVASMSTWSPVSRWASQSSTIATHASTGLGVLIGDGALGAEDFDRGGGLMVTKEFGRVAVDRIAEPVILPKDGGAEPLSQCVVAATDVDGGGSGSGHRHRRSRRRRHQQHAGRPGGGGLGTSPPRQAPRHHLVAWATPRPAKRSTGICGPARSTAGRSSRRCGSTSCVSGTGPTRGALGA